MSPKSNYLNFLKLNEKKLNTTDVKVITAFYKFFEVSDTVALQNSLKSILDQYFKSSVAELFSHYFGNIEKYKKLCFAHLSKIYIDSKLSIEEHCVTILRNACYTWDIYQLNYNMLDIIKFYSLNFY